MSTLRLWIIGTVLLAIVVGALGWFLGISPRIAEAAAAETQRQEVELQNAGYEATLIELRELSDNLPQLQAELDDLRVEIPDAPELPTLLGQINALAVAAGVDLNEVTANEPELVDPVLLEETGVTDLVAIPVTVSASGTDEALSEFLRQVQFGPRIFLVHTFTFGVEEDSGRLTLDGFIYVLPEEGAALPDVGTGEEPATEEPATEEPTDEPSDDPSASPEPTDPSASPSPETSTEP